MLRRAVATLLLLLIASPFTAPFVTCDVSMLLGRHMPKAQHQVTPAWTADYDAQAVALSAASVRPRTRVKLVSHFAAHAGTEPIPLLALHGRHATAGTPLLSDSRSAIALRI